MKILFENKAKSSNAAISSANQINNYLPANLTDSFLQKRYQSSKIDDIIEITFSEKITANCIFFAHHNLDRIEVVAYDTPELELWSKVFDDPPQSRMVFFDTVKKIRNIKIIVHGESGQSAAYLGGFAVGEAYTMPDPLNIWPIDFVDNSTFSASKDGQTLSNYITPLERREFQFRDIELARTREIVDHYSRVGVGGKVWLDSFEKTDILKPVYCAITDPIKAERDGRRFNFSMKFTEAR